jgi:hypothetical protein
MYGYLNGLFRWYVWSAALFGAAAVWLWLRTLIATLIAHKRGK